VAVARLFVAVATFDNFTFRGVTVTTTRTHFTFRVDTWTSDGNSIVEHVACVEDCQVALAT
jgi:hypothetical protein